MPSFKPVPVLYNVFPLQGGLDQITPPMLLKPGVALDALNFEVSVTGGYSRLQGYERYDGRTAPSTATFTAMTLSSIVGLNLNDTITNSGATGTAVVFAILGNTVLYTKQTGAFAVGDTIKVGTTTIGTAVSFGYVLTSKQTADYTAQAAAVYRSAITAVPGSGPVRGLFFYSNTLYAWRDNAGATGMDLYKSTTSGWTKVNFGYELAFTGGSGTAPAEGSTITQGGVSAVVRRVVLQTGAWGAGPCTGRFIIDAPTGGNFAAGAFTAGVSATCSGVQTAVTFLPGGRVQTVTGNFGGAQTTKVYGCDGVNRGWEFDGTVMVPIKTGMPSDKPNNVNVHKNYLFFTFGPSVQFSVLGFPYQWSAVLGAGELVVDDDVTALVTLPGNQSSGAMAVFTDQNTYILYGTSQSTFQLVPYNTGQGAKQYTTQNMEQTYLHDTRGVTNIQATLNFGNFDTSVLTYTVRPYLQAHVVNVSASLLHREKCQYRAFYSDGYGLYCTIVNGQYRGAMPVFFPNPVLVACEGQAADGSTVQWFGSSNGMVYRLDSGNNFDGAPVDYLLTLNFNAMGNTRTLKRYRKAALEMSGEGYTEFSMGYSLAYGNAAQRDQGQLLSYTTPLSPAYWDSFTWDNFTWDGQNLSPTEFEVTGSAENIAITLRGSSANYEAFTINTVTIHYSPRRGLR